ncbi:MAG: hypothetical protein QOE31_981 [Solirubrobacteraceae bacterium]|jgi:uncharacterized protein YjbI with pentapeptide repeats|nr:hypothetical protein [Solirubrobacteraceae bacterium]
MALREWDDEDFERALNVAEQERRIDASGVRVSAQQLSRLLAALPQETPGGPRHLADAVCRGTRFADGARFDRLRIGGTATFEGARFDGVADFRQVEFHGDAQFDRAWFRGGCDFAGAVFAGRAEFRDAQFFAPRQVSSESIPVASFAGASFAREATFDRARFHRDAIFSEAEFVKNIAFAAVRVMRDASFAGAAFRAPVVLGPLLVVRHLALDRAIFEEDGQVRASTNEFTCERARFVGRADLKLRWAEVVLDDAMFQQRSWLTGSPLFPGLAEADTTIAAGRRQDERSLAMQERPRLLSVREANISNLSLADVDLRACCFAKAQGLDQLRLETDCEFASRPGGWPFAQRRTLAEEHAWRRSADLKRRDARRQRWDARRKWLEGFRSSEAVRASQSRAQLRYEKRDNDRERRRADREHREWNPRTCRSPAWVAERRPVAALEPGEVATLYRSLRKALEDSKDEPGAGDLYYGEMEMRRRSLSTRSAEEDRDEQPAPDPDRKPRRIRRRRRAWRAERAIITLYWLLSGYGLRASRAMIALFVLVALSTAAFHLYGFRDRERPYATASEQRPQPRMEFPPSLAEVGGGLASFEAWTYSAGTATAIVGTPDARLTQTGRGLRIVLRILSPLLIGLALLAIRGRVKR